MARSACVGGAWWCATSFLALSGALTAQVVRVEAEEKISATAGGFGGALDPYDRFGTALAALGDLDGNGTCDLAVGAETDDDGGPVRGAVWILFLKPDGTVSSEKKINALHGGFGAGIDSLDFFGCSLAALGDLDGDGGPELAVGATHDDDGGEDQGAVWILSLNPDGTVASEAKISATAGGFGGELDPFDDMGYSVAVLGDLDGDGLRELAVGAVGDDDGPMNRGAVWILSLNPDGTVASEAKISATAGGFGDDLHGETFGASLAALGDFDGDAVPDLVVGSPEI